MGIPTLLLTLRFIINRGVKINEGGYKDFEKLINGGGGSK